MSDHDSIRRGSFMDHALEFPEISLPAQTHSPRRRQGPGVVRVGYGVPTLIFSFVAGVVFGVDLTLFLR